MLVLTCSACGKKLRVKKEHDGKLSWLRGMPLVECQCDINPERDAEVLRSIQTLVRINEKPAAEFWKEMEEQKLVRKP